MSEYQLNPYLPILAALLAETDEHENAYAANLELADALVARGELYAALAVLERALAAAHALQDGERKALVLLRQASICDDWGQWDKAEATLGRAERTAAEGSGTMAAVVHQKGILRQKRGDYDGALELYQKSLAAC